MPNSLTSIGDEAFAENSLTFVTIPSDVTTIGTNAFTDNLMNAVISESNNPAILYSGTFDDLSTIDLTIPAGYRTAYRSALWTGFNSVTEDAALSINDLAVLKNLSIITTNNTLKVITSDTLEELDIYSLIGSKVAVGNTTELPISHLSSGIYIAKIKTDKGMASKKFVKK